MTGFLSKTRNRSCTIPGNVPAMMLALGLLIVVLTTPAAQAASVVINPVTPDPVTGELVPLGGTGFRWLVQQDDMYAVEPGVTCQDGDPATCPSVNFHRSHIPVVQKGDNGDSMAVELDHLKRYYVSVLPDEGYALGGAPVVFPAGSTGTTEITVDVVVQPYPIPTTQIRVFLFEDGGPGSFAPVNNAPDAGEPGLGGWRITLEEPGGKYGIPGGQVVQDAFGNPVGSTYDTVTGDLLVKGSGQLISGDDGYLQIKNIPPAKYGIIVTPEKAAGCPSPDQFGRNWVGTGEWQQTTTIEGSPVIDAWVKANEPPFFVEFGPPGPHVFMGFTRDCRLAPSLDGPFGDSELFPADPNPGTTLSGTITNLHLNRPPDFGYGSANAISECYIAINDMALGDGQSIYSAPCDTSLGSEGNSDFTIDGIRDGSYQIAVLDANLLLVIGLQNVLIEGGQCSRDNGLTFGSCSLGEVPAFNWFGRHEHTVFLDRDMDGFRDPDEPGILEQGTNLRFRDGTVYQSFPTDLDGAAPYDEVFPFFSWLVTEVDFGRFQATGVTVVTDAGGTVPADNGWAMPSRGVLNPQPQFCTQADVDEGVLADEIAGTPCTLGAPIINPNTGNNLSRTYTGTVLTMGIQTFLGQTNVLEWGKYPYDPKNPAAGNNGGVSGVVFYAITRAEDDPRFAAGEEWEPGIPRIQMALYSDFDGDGQIDDLDGDGVETVADVDNYPFGNFPGAEDFDYDSDTVFDYGDAIQIGTTDSWDDSVPTGCQGDIFYVCGGDWPATQICDPANLAAAQAEGYTGGAPSPTDCFDGLRNYNQVRPAVFDGGYAFESYFEGGMANNDTVESEGLPSGEYIVGTGQHPVYQVLKEEDRNVDWGDEYTPGTLLLPATCVGDDHVVPAELALFPGEPAYYGGQTRQLCDRKLVAVKNGSNTAADFWMFTEVPIGAQLTGFILDDLANEFDPNAPTFGEKYSPPFIPVAIFDWSGEEVGRTYSDRWGKYNAVVPSTFSANLPMPSGMSPNMLTACMNHPGPVDNPSYDPNLCADGVVPGVTDPQDPETDCINGTVNPSFDDRTTIMDPYFKRQYSQFCYIFQYMPGSTTYLDTPVVPVAAFAGPGSEALDCQSPDGTPVIFSVSDPKNGIGGGPYITERTTGPARYNKFDIVSMGTVQVPNPDWDGIGPGQLIDRDFGFGDVKGDVFIGSMQLANNQVGWSNELINIKNIDIGSLPEGRQLRIVRGDNGAETVQGLTLTFEGDLPAGASALSVAPGGDISTVIQSARAGDLVLVPPGTYQEMVIMSKPVLLQGWGSGSVTINASHVPAERLFDWRSDVANLTDLGVFDTLPGQIPPAGANAGLGGTVFNTEEGPGILVLSKNRGAAAATLPGYGRLCADGTGAIPCGDGSTPRPNARIDGLAVTGAAQGGGIFVNGYARWLQIGNNRIAGNQGTFGGGIRLGHPLLGVEDPDGGVTYADAQNNNISIFNNHIKENGGQGGYGGGISINNGADNYKVFENLVCGNFTQGSGGGIGHNGWNQNGRIVDNTIIFNQSFHQGTQQSGGGLYIGGAPPLVGTARTEGSGDVLVDANLIQGNLAGAGDGGGMRLARINGQDVADNPGPWICYSCGETELVCSGDGNTACENDAECNVAGGTCSVNLCTSWDALVGEVGGEDADVACLGHATCRNSPYVPGGSFDELCSDLPPDQNAAMAPFQGWSQIRVFNNIVADNVSGLAGAGVSMQDAAWVDIENNTIVNNDAVGTAGVAFGKPNESSYQPAGVVTREHSGDLNALLATERALFPNSTRLSTFTDPRLYNNLIQHNRSFKYAQCSVPPMDPALFAAECISGELANDFKGLYPVADPTGANHRYWDLSVADLPGEFLNPRSSILSSTENGAPINMAPYHGSNSTSDADHHIASYFNGEPGQTIIQTEGTVIAVTPAFDEGGNFIDVRFSPLSLLTSDYHLAAGSSAIDGGDASVLPASCIGNNVRTALCRDLDNESREGVIVDIGADEYDGVAVAGAADGGVGAEAGDSGDFGDGFSSNSVDRRRSRDRFGRDDRFTSPVPGGDLVGDGGRTGDDSINLDLNLGLTGGETAATQDNAPTASTGTGGATADSGLAPDSGDGSDTGGGNVGTLAYGDCVPGEGVCDCLDLWGPQGDPWGNTYEAGDRCMHIGGGDGYSWMSTGYLDPYDPDHPQLLYGFSFRDLTGTIGGGLNVDEGPAFEEGFIGAEFPAPSIVLEEDDQFYLHLSNVGMAIRPDLFDPHTVHWHGFPEASVVFDGVPDASISINMFATLTYYFNVVRPGTYMYHCHVEATEHMQMGMMGNLYVHAAQGRTGYDADGDGLLPCDIDSLTAGTCANDGIAGDADDAATVLNPASGAGYVYNDGDGSSYYDKEFPVQLMTFDGDFHVASETVQPLPFAMMEDDYALINGRGYPATVDPNDLSHDARGVFDAPKASQRVSSLIEATVGEKVLLRMSNLSVTKAFTITTLGLPMQVVGVDARLFRGKGGADLFVTTGSVSIGPGESRDVLVDTTNVAPGRYFLYTTNLNYLSNSGEDFGGMMTEIVISAP